MKLLSTLNAAFTRIENKARAKALVKAVPKSIVSSSNSYLLTPGGYLCTWIILFLSLYISNLSGPEKNEVFFISFAFHVAVLGKLEKVL